MAWPAEHGRTGVQTYLVAMDGSIWRRDLGPGTSESVAEIRSLDPASGWDAVVVGP